MLVSHVKRFVLLHIPKTGGSSITKLLSPYLDTVDPAARRYCRRHYDVDTKRLLDEWSADDIREFGYVG
jgi:hypothetical protein